MRRRRWILLTTLAGFALLWVVTRPPYEPRYQNKPLSAWLQDFASDRPQVRWQAAEAVRQIGTNSVPYLKAKLGEEEPMWKSGLRMFLIKTSLVNVGILRYQPPRDNALAGLDALGLKARGAAPELEKLLYQNPPDYRAIMVLARLGPDGVPALTRVLTNEDRLIRIAARVCLEMQKTNSEFLFPKTPIDEDFQRRICQFNIEILKSSLTEYTEYKKQHPEKMLPDTPETILSTSLPPNAGTNAIDSAAVQSAVAP